MGDVNDVVADVFVVAWRKIDRIPPEGEVLPWLYGIARNEIRNRHRAARRARALRSKLAGQADPAEPGPEPVVIRNAELRHVMSALESLSPDDQEVLLLRAHEELGYSELGIALGCSSEAARKRLTRAIARLRRAGGYVEPGEQARVRATKGGDQ